MTHLGDGCSDMVGGFKFAALFLCGTAFFFSFETVKATSDTVVATVDQPDIRGLDTAGPDFVGGCLGLAAGATPKRVP